MKQTLRFPRLSRIMALAALAALGSAMAATDAAAQSAGSGLSSVRGVALIIGNASYKKAVPLSNPVNDANDVAKAMRDLGWQVIVETDATLGAMKQAVRDFASKLRGQPAGFFYYAGHGVQFDGVNYLVPVDADIQLKAETQASTVSMDFVLQAMDETGVPVKMVIMDACRDNPFEKTRSAGGASRGLAVVGSQPRGTVLVYATAPGDVSLDGKGRNGVFTEAFLPNLATPGLEFKEIFDLTGAAVQERTGGKQSPWINSSYYGKLYLVSPEEAGALAGARLSTVQGELERLAKQQESIAAAQAAARDQSERDRLAQEARVLAAKNALAREEATMLERAQLAASARAAEEERNRDLEASRVREAEAQLASLRKQAEERRSLMGGGAASDDLSRTYWRLKALDEAVGEIEGRFNVSRDAQLAVIKQAYDKRVAEIDRYTKDPWENAKEFEQRKGEAKSLAKRDLERESASLRANYEASILRETAELRSTRSEIETSLGSKTWGIKAKDLRVTRSAFDEERKLWTFNILGSGSANGLQAVAEYRISYKSMSELAAAYKKLDAAWANNLLEPRALVGVTRLKDGNWRASVREVSLVDMSTGAELAKARIINSPSFVPPPPEATPAKLSIEGIPSFGKVKVGDRTYKFSDGRGGRLSLDKVQTLVTLPLTFLDGAGTAVAVAGVTKIMLGEGEEETISLPGGWLTVPKLPDGAELVIVSNDAKGLLTEQNLRGQPALFELVKASPGAKLRALPGTWTVGVRCYAAPGMTKLYTRSVTVADGALVSLAPLQDDIRKDIQSIRQALAARLAAANKKHSAGWLTMAGSTASAGAAVASFVLGSAAMQAYQAAATTSAAQAARDSAELWGVLMPLSAGVGATGFLVSMNLWNKGDKPGEIRRDIAEVDGYLKQLKD